MATKKILAKNGNRRAEIPAGLVAIFVSFFVVAAIVTHLDIIPDYTNIHEDLSYLGENLNRLTLNTFCWLINSILIILLGAGILISFLPHSRSSSYLAAFLISSTGIVYLFYSINGFNLIYLVNEYLKTPDIESEALTTIALEFLITKSSLQLVAYTLAGISAVILGQFVARTGYLPRFIGWMAILGGLVYATYGWVSLDSIIFSIGRLLFILSLILFGSYLLLRGTIVKKKES